jgi:hypothetical protein
MTNVLNLTHVTGRILQRGSSARHTSSQLLAMLAIGFALSFTVAQMKTELGRFLCCLAQAVF